MNGSLRLDSGTRRKNRVALIVLLAASLLAAASGTLYLRHYGFNTPDKQEQTRYH